MNTKVLWCPGIIRTKRVVGVLGRSLCQSPHRPTSVWIRPLGGHARPLAVVPHSLRASLQLLQPNPQLPLLPEQTALQLLCTLILLLQLLKWGGREENKWAADKASHPPDSSLNQELDAWGVVFTFMWSWARRSRLRVVFLTESDDRGTCFLSCSRQCLNWARLHNTTSANTV